jgi:hypothetical protein
MGDFMLTETYTSNKDSGLLPEWIKQQEGKLVYAENDGEQWDFIFDYGTQLKMLQQPTEMSALHNVDNVIWGEPLGQISKPFREITYLANAANLKDPDVSLLYKSMFVIGTRQPLQAALDYVKPDVVLAPMRGAKILKVMLESLGVSADNMPFYRAARKLVNGNYTVGINGVDSFIDGGNILFVDDVVAAFGSEKSSYDAWVSVMHHQPTRYAVCAGMGVNRAIMTRQSLLEAEKIDYKMFFGAVSHRLNDRYYLTLTDEEKTHLDLPNSEFRVGDMGDAMGNIPKNEEHLIQDLTVNPTNDDTILELVANERLMGRNDFSQAARSVRTVLANL